METSARPSSILVTRTVAKFSALAAEPVVIGSMEKRAAETHRPVAGRPDRLILCKVSGSALRHSSIEAKAYGCRISRQCCESGEQAKNINTAGVNASISANVPARSTVPSCEPLFCSESVSYIDLCFSRVGFNVNWWVSILLGVIKCSVL
jgi:hypothetical protein